MNIVGLDIGGANLKVASAAGQADAIAFPLWKEPHRLGNELHRLLGRIDPATHFAVTMTAELADCFETKAEGVDSILRSIKNVAVDRPIAVWQTGGEFVSTEVALDIPLLVAAANWHALATWVGRIVPVGPSMLVDIGSSTTDIIPLIDGRRSLPE